MATGLRPPLACLRRRWSRAEGGAGGDTASRTSGPCGGASRIGGLLRFVELHLQEIEPAPRAGGVSQGSAATTLVTSGGRSKASGT
jgi:hypothetical protein